MGRVFFVVAVTAALAACQPPTIGGYPDSVDDSVDLPPKPEGPSVTGGGSAGSDGDAGLRPKGKPVVTVTILGAGSVRSTPPGLTCTAGQCSGSFDVGTAVTLTPVPAAGTFFTGWSGACTGAAACAPAIAADVTLSAEFQSVSGTWTGNYTHS